MQDKLSENFANYLKELRTSHGLSLQKTADLTGISKSMLGQIERLESSPTISTIWKIAAGFDLSFSQLSGMLFTDVETPQTITDEGLTVTTLFPYDEMTGSEIFEIKLAAKCIHQSPAHNEGVTEHILLLSGELSIGIAELWHDVTATKKFFFNGNKPHSYKNNGECETKFYLIMHYCQPKKSS